MTLHKNKYRIESTRLKEWDYSSPGYYFVTICANKRECLFGEIIDRKMVMNEFGKIVQNCWDDLVNHYEWIQLDEFIVMPNHIHGILVIRSISTKNKKQQGLSEIIRALKSYSAKRINIKRNTPGVSVWQPRFYDHIIRDEDDLLMIREYIHNNPAKWEEDEEYVP